MRVALMLHTRGMAGTNLILLLHALGTLACICNVAPPCAAPHLPVAAVGDVDARVRPRQRPQRGNQRLDRLCHICKCQKWTMLVKREWMACGEASQRGCRPQHTAGAPQAQASACAARLRQQLLTHHIARCHYVKGSS